MNRRSFLKTIAVATTALAADPTKFLSLSPKPLTGRHYSEIWLDDIETESSALTPEMLQNAFHYFDKVETQPTILILSEHEKAVYEELLKVGQ